MTSLNDILAAEAKRLGYNQPAPFDGTAARKLTVVGNDNPRAQRWVSSKIDAQVEELAAMPPNSGRNHALNAIAYSLGRLAPRWVDPAEIADQLLVACMSNGLVAEDGRTQCEKTIGSGLNKGMQDPRDPPIDEDDSNADNWLRSLPDAERPAQAPAGVNTTTGEIDDAEKTLEQLQAEMHTRAVNAALRDIRIKHEANLAHKAEIAAATFREPPSVFTLADELQIPDEPVTYAIEDLLPTGANALLAAQFKTGKTTFINNYARAFADGTLFLGRYRVNPAGGRIALYNYELDPSMNRRWLRDMGIRNPDRVVVLNLRGFRLPITAPSVEDWVVRWLADREVTAWIVDPFARASVGLDENSNSEVGVWLDTLDIIKNRAGVRDLVLPTHTGRAEQEQGAERARGATRLDDWADVRWLLTKDDNDNRFFRATGRDVDVAEELLNFREQDRSLTIGGGDRKWVKGRDAEARVFVFIKATPGASSGEIERGAGGHKPDNTSALRRLTSGLSAAVRVEIDGQKHRHYVNREDL